MLTLIFRFRFLILLPFLGGMVVVNGQNAPVTTAATIGGANPGNISVPVTVTGFTGISAISLSIEYDYAVMHFTGATPNPALPSFPTGEIDLGTGIRRISLGWFGPSTSLADGSAIITLHFTYIGGITGLDWYDNGPSCEYADANYTVLNDIPQEDFYIDGHVCGIIGTPGPVSGPDSLCAGQTGIVYSISPVPNATEYTWTVPENVIIISGQNTTSVFVEFLINATSGNIGVITGNPCGTGPSAVKPVTVNPVPVANAGNDTTINYGTSITLHAAPGGNGSYAYHWAPEELLVDPDVQNPQTVILTETSMFTLHVTNLATLCEESDMLFVTITGGPLSANPTATPPLICRYSSSWLFSNAGGGSGNYNYLWTCVPPCDPPWSSTEANPFVAPDVSQRYHLTVNDGFTTIEDSVFVAVAELPTSTLTGGDTLCGPGTFTTLQVDLTGTPPWFFTYSFGNTTVFVNDVLETPYYITTGDPGDYMISLVEDANCIGITYGTAMVRAFPIPAKPEITVYGTELISSSCCGNQWYKNGVLIPGAGGQTYQVTQNGEYFVIVTLNSCSSEPSDTVDMIVGIPEYLSPKLEIFPNPSKGLITINTGQQVDETAALELYSSSGYLIKKNLLAVTHKGTVTIDISSFPEGLYFIILKTSTRISSGKLIKD
ncbi:MAG TPA: T9SS type A sorting domain-containing protein [Bacteroidales bacterium]|nr:T9SS type A sorting domain-containing protein [Bacteroidales bacterium]